MAFKAAAREVLREVGRRLHYGDITELALEAGYLASSGRTPQNTMRARPAGRGRRLPYGGITELAPEAGYLASSGRPPQNTMRARLSVDVRDNPETPFVPTAPGGYGPTGTDRGA